MSNNNQNKKSNDWKWNQSFDVAAKAVQEAFGITPDQLKKAGKSDAETKKLIQAADASDVDVRRTKDAIAAQKKLITNTNQINGAIHGLIRFGLDAVSSLRKNESTTAKRLSKFNADIAVLDAKTNKAAEKDFHRMGAAIGQINNETNLDKERITQHYTSLGEIANQRHQQALQDIQTRQQKRIEGSKKPWKQ